MSLDKILFANILFSSMFFLFLKHSRVKIFATWLPLQLSGCLMFKTQHFTIDSKLLGIWKINTKLSLLYRIRLPQSQIDIHSTWGTRCYFWCASLLVHVFLMLLQVKLLNSKKVCFTNTLKIVQQSAILVTKKFVTDF